MIAEIAGAVEAVGKLVSQVLTRLWGTQTRADADIERDAVRAEAQYHQAVADRDVDAANAARDALERLRQEAAARRLGRT